MDSYVKVLAQRPYYVRLLGYFDAEGLGFRIKDGTYDVQRGFGTHPSLL